MLVDWSDNSAPAGWLMRAFVYTAEASSPPPPPPPPPKKRPDLLPIIGVS
jgi:hypothetical protein